jgi:hypothetical protein
VNDELDRYYELLGVAPGTRGHELKEAYRDLAKVWHPDRFSQDARLQQKAQEKLKEINKAYERLTSGRAERRPRTAHAPDKPPAPNAATVGRQRPRLVLPIALVFCAAFVAALISLVPPQARPAPDRTPPTAPEDAQPSDKGQQPESGTRGAASQPARGKERSGRQSPTEATSGGDPVAEPSGRQLQPIPTVTVTIDALNGLLATRDCPSVSTLTYPAGDEPRQYCTVQHKTKIIPPAEPAQSKGSRLKSIGKRLAAPFN